MIVAAVAISAYAVVYGRAGEVPFLPETFKLTPPYRIDLDVYRLGAETLLRGGDLYGTLPDTEIGANLPFTYPPIAAMLFVPLALLTMRDANLLFSFGTLGLLVVVLTLVLREFTGLRGRQLVLGGLAAGAIGFWLGPVRESVEFGQVNVALMALIVVDVVVGRGKRWQGMLTGLAMAIKLTPAVFLAYFLVKREWRALITAALSALLFTGLGFLVAWEHSITYWTGTITDPDRIGGLAYVSNQSINGVLLRLGLTGGAATLTWFLLSAVLGLSLLALMAQLFRRGHGFAAALTMGFYALLASPVSWSHHWVWAGPAIVVLLLWARRSGSPGALALAGSGLLIFITRLIWDLPDEDALQGLNWTWQQHLQGNAQAVWGLAFLAFLAFGAPARAEAMSVETEPEQPSTPRSVTESR